MPEASKWQLVGWAVAAALLVLTASRWLDAGGGGGAEGPPVRIDGGAGARAGGGGGEGGQGGAGSGPLIYVHVAGAVRRPGLYRVREGSRVAVALHRAGGPRPRAEMTAVNLAQPLEDGQQVVVPLAVPGAPLAAGGNPAAPGEPGSVPISLATATPEQLEELDGIGETLAARIIEQRDESGGFRSIEELREVDGIGEVRFAALAEAVRP